MRFRHWFMFIGSFVVLAALFASDPDVGFLQSLPFGGSTLAALLIFSKAILAITFAHFGRRALFDYQEGDFRSTASKARETSTGSGLLAIAYAIVLYGLLALFSASSNAQDVRTYIPQPAKFYLTALKEEQNKYWPTHPIPAALASLIEHESCISLKHSKCWNPKSSLKTKREEGAGFAQITRAYTKTGAIRFDALTELKQRHPILGEWNWKNVYTRPDLQLAAVVLKSHDDFKSLSKVTNPLERLYFTDAAYNGGLGGVQNERRACGLKKNCDPQRWFDNVENTCLKSTVGLYGARSPCEINRHHVEDVYHIRLAKYEPFFTATF